ncbi:hypothetical protein, partial [Bacillus cereus]|uniref:hypothetical protein n=1 Tax=Bacillus cereus TaxID=1396 RepID=UPI0020CA6778
MSDTSTCKLSEIAMVFVRIIRYITKWTDKCRDICSGAKNEITYVISGNTQTGYGVTTALFKSHGFIVISKKDLTVKAKPFFRVLGN